MKTFVKTSMVAALALATATFGTSNAQARGWPIAAGVLGGLAVGAAVVAASTPAYVYPAYSYPVYPTGPTGPTCLTYATAGPVVQTIAPQPVYVRQPAPVYYYPSPVVYAAPYPYVYPYVRFGWGGGCRHYHYGHRRW